MNIVLSKFQTFALKPKVCEMGGNRLQKGLNLLCRVWPSGKREQRSMLRSHLDAWSILKICSQFSENAIFEKFVAILFLQTFQLFQFFFFSLVHQAVRKHTNLVKEFFF